MTKPEADFPRRVAKSVLLATTPEIKSIIHLCSVREPAEIRSVRFRPGEVKIDLRWAFDSPSPTGNPDDRLGTRKDVNRFRQELRAYFLEQHAGRQLANTLHDQFVDFLPRFLGLARFERLPIGSGTLQDELVSIARTIKAGRLAGRKKIILPDTMVLKIKRESAPIARAILELQDLLTSWVDQDPKLTEALLKERTREHFDREQYPWMRHFTRAFLLLEVKVTRKAVQRYPSLSDPRQWSAIALARLIVKEKLRYDTGIDCPLAAIAKIVKSPTRRRKK